MSEWQDISTAPKDGTRILGYDGFDIVIMEWWAPDLDDFEDDDPPPTPSWCSYSSEGDEFIERPTHWMSLPEPPK